MSLSLYFISERCPTCGRYDEGPEGINITHNLIGMAEEAGIYGMVWRPKENGIVHLRQLIDPLVSAIAQMEEDPDRFKKYDDPNDWGTYEQFLPWLKKLLRICENNPNAEIEACR